MDIIVEGRGKKYFKADKISIRFNFFIKKPTYELAVSEGAENVEMFLKNVLNKMNFTKDDLKTESFKVCEETRYDSERKVYLKDGFSYSQVANLEFDYSADKLAEMIDRVSKFENPPKYFLKFGIKDMAGAKKEALAEAYLKAKEKAEIIAAVAGKNLKDCIKTDFRPFEEKVISNTNLDLEYSYRAKSAKVETAIQNVFTPEDIEVSEALYCLWIAE